MVMKSANLALDIKLAQMDVTEACTAKLASKERGSEQGSRIIGKTGAGGVGSGVPGRWANL